MNLLQKQKEINTFPSFCKPTVAPPWYQFGFKWDLSINAFHCYLNAMTWSRKKTSLTRFWWWSLKHKTISFPHAWNITSYWWGFFFLPFLLDEVARYSRSNMWVKQKLYERLIPLPESCYRIHITCRQPSSCISQGYCYTYGIFQYYFTVHE